MVNLFDADYLMKHELVFIGSPDTMTRKIRTAAQTGLFNVFLGEFNFSDLPAEDVMRSIRLFGDQVIPRLRDYEPIWYSARSQAHSGKRRRVCRS